MGVVAKCTHLGLNELVALKMLRQDVLLDRDATERFMREAQAASKLRSEHVARVVDVGTFPDSGVPYMVMEFLDGHDLGELIEQRGTIPAPWASMLMLQAAEALAEAHSIGIVHRDVKPTNLFVTWRPDGSAIVKVLDFGISKAPMGTDMQLTQTQSLLGTPAYMSPEQMRSARMVDARTDIWSLGTVMYELLEGRRPFEADSFSEMCVKVAVDAPEPMTKTPPALQQVVLRCLAKTPDQRYASMAELGRDLIPFAQDPHGAALLVERMQRVLGRRNHDWEAGTNGGRATPMPIRDIASSPIQIPRRTGTDPAAQRYRTPALGIPQTVLQHESAPASAPSEIMVLPQPRSKLPLFFIGALLVAGVALLMVLVLGRRTEQERTVPPPTPVSTTPAPVAVDRATDDVKRADAEAAQRAEEAARKAAAAAATKQIEIDMRPNQPVKPRVPVIKRVNPNKTGAVKTVKPGKDSKEVKPDKPELKPVDDCPAIDRIRPGAPCPTKSH